MARVAFYYNHYNTLGHSTRVFSLVKGLKDYFKGRTEIIILQGGKRQDIFPFSQYGRLYLLPYSMDKRGFFIEENYRVYNKMVSSGKLHKMLHERLEVIKNALHRFSPDIFITEYFPFGKEFWTFEVPYLLDYLREHHHCKIIGSSGYLSWVENTYDCIRDFYDMVLIHSPEEFSDERRFYLPKRGIQDLDRLFSDFSHKIHFTGFVFTRQKVEGWSRIRRKYLQSGYKNLVLVSRGGGIVNNKIILVSIMLARRMRDLFFVICCGPATSSKELREYKRFSRGVDNLEIIDTIHPHDFDTYIKAADISINMAGYNTTSKLLYYRKKTVLVPFYTAEQRWRAELVKRYLPSRIIQENELGAQLLEQHTLDLLNVEIPSSKIKADWFLGTSNSIKMLKCFM